MTSSKSSTKPLEILFIHPDLGIGGAERLVIDAAVGLQERGHGVSVWTSHCDPSHCFDEARDGTLKVHVPRTLIPRTILSRFAILLAILRQVQLVLTLYLRSLLSAPHAPDVIFLDQLSASLPLLRLLAPHTSLLFYVHFPDLLLAPHSTRLQKLYRQPFDALEAFSTGTADRLAVNSLFTRSVFTSSFPLLASRPTHVIYPCVSTSQPTSQLPPLWSGSLTLLLSLNRFEPKKNLAHAIHTYASLPSAFQSRTRLIIAGGYDSRLSLNVQTLTALRALCSTLNLPHHTASTLPTALSTPSRTRILFLPSVTAPLKALLLSQSRLLLYTPPNEHFGIVPLEAMLAGTPVLAADSGGPLETVRDPLFLLNRDEKERTGWLRPADDVKAWRDVVVSVLEMEDEPLGRIGERGRESVVERFSRETMAERLEGVMREMVDERMEGRRGGVLMGGWYAWEWLGVGTVVVAALIKVLFF
ncbi:MAG: Alpha-1,3-mannosyltransferase-like protein [Vezdaea aestivalis]|nr:MAG: Alpha-1,3-mannosyltransferase-like protein [Vezdaea aestivalis]